MTTAVCVEPNQKDSNDTDNPNDKPISKGITVKKKSKKEKAIEMVNL